MRGRTYAQAVTGAGDDYCQFSAAGSGKRKRLLTLVRERRWLLDEFRHDPVPVKGDVEYVSRAMMHENIVRDAATKVTVQLRSDVVPGWTSMLVQRRTFCTATVVGGA